jgi:drug/metabolite transporter (DMT)-like permease
MADSNLDYVSLDSKKPSNLWLLTSVLSLLTLGVGCFLVGAYPLTPYFGKAMVSCGYFFLAFVLTIYFWILKSIHLGRCATISDTTIFKNSRLAPGILSSVLVGICNNFGNLTLFLGYSDDPSNKGVISIMVVGSAIISAIIVYFMYDEKLGYVQIGGMGICVLGLLTIAYASGVSGSLGGFVYGFLSLLCFAIRNVALRSCEVGGLDVETSIVVNLYFEAIGGVATLLVVSGFMDIFTDMETWYYSFIGGIFMALGVLFITHAVMFGKVGPAVMIANTLGILQMALDYIFFAIEPDLIKVIGSVVCLLGVGILLMSPQTKSKNN